jgi:hypothetical protein
VTHGTGLRLDQQAVRDRCSHCGREFSVIRGSAYEDNGGIALYLAGLHSCDGPPIAHLAVAIRPGYRDNAGPEAILLQVWTTDDSIDMRVTDAVESPWRGEAYLGRLLNRDEALASPLLETVYRIAGRVARDNAAVSEYLNADQND